MKILKNTISILLLMTLIMGCTGEFLTLKEIKKRDRMTMDLLDISATTLEEVKAKVANDPYNPINERIPELEATLAYAKKVQGGQILFNLEEMLQRFNRIKTIRANLKQSIYVVLETDISFPSGKYEISDILTEGKDVLDASIEKIISFTNDLRQQIPKDTLVITIATIGYADASQPNKKLEFDLAKNGLGAAIVTNKTQLRQLLNKELSHRRAEAVNQYLTQHLKEQLFTQKVILGEPRITGLGEEFPTKNVSPRYKESDKRRRICKVYSNVLTISAEDREGEIIP